MDNYLKYFTILSISILFTLKSNFANAQVTILNEDFSSALSSTPPNGWNNSTLIGTTNDLWRFDNPGGLNIGYPLTYPFASINSLYSSNNLNQEEIILESKFFDASVSNNIVLRFDHIVNQANGSICHVEVFNGNTWMPIITYNSDISIPQEAILNISNAAGGITNSKIRFRWTGNGGGYWAIDNISVYSPVNNDLSVSISDPVYPYQAGQQPLAIRITNTGLDTVLTTQINWQINNGPTSSIMWAGILAPTQQETVMLDSIDVSIYQSLLIKCYTNQPNGIPDQNPFNDTAKATIAGSACGIYTVGGNNPDFATISEAVNFMTQNGVSCPTTIYIRNGIYNESIQIGPFPGSSSQNTVTFTSEQGDSSLVKIRNNNHDNTISLNDAKFLYFENIGIRGLQINNKSGNIYIKNCQIPNGIYISESNEIISITSNLIHSINVAYNTNERIVVENNTFGQVDGNIAQRFIHINRTRINNKFIIINNIFKNSTTGNINGIFFDLPIGKMIVQHNTFYNVYPAMQSFGNPHSIDFSYNKINNDYTSNNSDNNSIILNTQDSVNIYNNYFNLKGSEKIVCFKLIESAQAFTGIFHNSINLNSSKPTSSIFEFNTSAPRTIYNNIGKIKNEGYIIYQSTNNSNALMTLNKNAYHSLSNSKFYVGGIVLNTFNEWISYSNQDTNSVYADPHFESDSVLIPGQYLLNKAGITLPLTSLDIDSNTRTVPPDIGASEFELCNFDAGINGFLDIDGSVQPGIQNIKILLANHGTDTLISSQINYSVNENLQTAYNWTGSLPPGRTDTITIGSFNFQDASRYLIKAWTTLSSNTDCNTNNDTSMIISTSPMCGHYTIGGLNPDFATFTDAIEILSKGGVNCPVIFSVRDGSYNEQLQLQPISGSSNINTITFRSETGDSNSVNVFKNNSYYSLNISDARYLYFQKMTINGISINNRAGDIHISNCILKSGTVINSSISTIDFFNNIIYNLGISYGTNEKIIIRNNIFTSINGDISGRSIVVDRTVITNELIITSNHFNNNIQGRIVNGIFFSLPVGKMTVRHNQFTNISPAVQSFGNPHRIDFSYNRYQNNQSILNSTLKGISLYTQDSCTIYNNYFTFNCEGPVTAFEFEESNTAVTSLFHNSIQLNSKNANSTIIRYGTNATRRIFNNILHSVNQGYLLFQLLNTTNASLLSNNNNYFSGGSKPFYFGGNILNSLEQWKSFSNNDVASLYSNPYFLNDSILKPTQSMLNGTGGQLPFITHDIDSTPRNNNADIGAKEFDICPYDIGINEIIGNSNQPVAGNNILRAILINHGTNPVTQLSIKSSINGIVQNTFNYQGNLLPGSRDTIAIGSYFFQDGPIYRLKVWSETSDNIDCQSINDTASKTIIISLCGVYTVGGTNPDFNTLVDASRILNQHGVSCAVKMKIRQGSSLSPVDLFSIQGSSVLNTIEFTTDSNDSTSFLQSGLVNLVDAQNIIFNRLSLNSISISGQSGNITFKNSAIHHSPVIYASSGRITFHNNMIFEPFSLTGINHRIEIDQNKFQALSSRATLIAVVDRLNTTNGLYFTKNSTLNTNQNLCDRGIRFVLTSGNVYIDGNEINNTKTAIINDGPNSSLFQISDNRISTLGSNYDLTGINTGFNPNDQFQIINNYIHLTGNGRNTGIHLDLRNISPISKQATLLYNTVIVGGSNGLNCSLYAPGIAPFRLRNNIFKNNNSSPAIFISNPITSQYDFDYNNYFSANGLLALYNGTPYPTLGQWQSTISADANSQSIDPAFVLTKPTLPANRQLNGAGIAAGGVLLDIDGEIRNQSAPDPGCDEFMVDFGITRLENPTLACDQGDSVPVVVFLSQFGDIPFINVKIAYQVDNGPIFMDTIPGSISNDLTYTFNQAQDLTQNGVYQFKIWLVDNNDDNINNDTLRITRYSQPSPQVSFTSGSGCAGTTIPFAGSATIAQGSINAFEWDFGDGNADTNAVTTHVYEVSGEYPVTLFAFSNIGCYGSLSDTVHIFNTPIASFTSNPGCANDTIVLVNTTIQDDSLSAYIWKTYNTITSLSENPSPFILAPGSYLLSLTVTNSNGCIDSAQEAIEIRPLPQVTLPDYGPYCANSAPVFITGGLPSGGLYEGNELINRFFNPAVSGPGVFQITYSYLDSAGCIGRVIDSIRVFGVPDVTLSATTDTSICFGDSLVVQAFGATDYLWSNGTAGPSIVIKESGIYNCTGTSTNACSASSANIRIAVLGDALPDSTLNINLCYGDTYTLPNGQVVGGGEYSIAVTSAEGCDSIVVFDIRVQPESQSITSVTTCTFFTWNGQTYSQTGTYNYTTTNSYGCDSVARLNLIISPLTITVTSTSSSNSTNNDGTATALVSGGNPPYAYTWNIEPSQTGATAINLAAGTYAVQVTDANGCSATALVQVSLSNEQCEPFRTYGKGGWGAVNNGFNPGTYLVNNFSAAYPNGLRIGACNRYIQLNSAAAVTSFLPTSGTPARLPNTTLLNPTSFSYSNTLAGHLVALNLNLTFDSLNPGFAASTVMFKNALIASGPFVGYTVQQLYDEANQAIGCSNNKTYLSRLNKALDSTNASWRNGIRRNNFIVCPGTLQARLMESANEPAEINGYQITVYPNPSSGLVNLRQEGDTPQRIELYNILGKCLLDTSWKPELDLKSLPNGIYLLRVILDDGHSVVQRIELLR